MEAPGRSASVDQQREALRHRRGVVELDERQHRAEAVAKLDGALAVYVRPPAIGNGIVVAVFDLDREVERLAGLGGAHEQRVSRQRRDRPAAEPDVRHRDPGSELPDRLRHEARREVRDVARDREGAARARAGNESRDPVDEGERCEVIRHPHRTARQPAALASRCA